MSYYLGAAACVFVVVAVMGLLVEDKPGVIVSTAVWYAALWPLMLVIVLAEAWYFWKRSR